MKNLYVNKVLLDNSCILQYNLSITVLMCTSNWIMKKLYAYCTIFNSYSLYMAVFAAIYVYALLCFWSPERPECDRSSRIELQMAVSHHVGMGNNGSQVLWQTKLVLLTAEPSSCLQWTILRMIVLILIKCSSIYSSVCVCRLKLFKNNHIK